MLAHAFLVQAARLKKDIAFMQEMAHDAVATKQQRRVDGYDIMMGLTW